jgi:alkyl hydroperoxide reductase subunit AhpF
MSILDEKTQAQVREQLKGLKEPVRLAVFTQEVECQYCRENTALAREVADLSDLVTAEVYDFALDAEAGRRYDIDKIPAIVVEGQKDYGIRFYGVPFGYEFVSLLEAIQAVSARDSGLSLDTRKMLAQVKDPVHLQVFVTLT